MALIQLTFIASSRVFIGFAAIFIKRCLSCWHAMQGNCHGCCTQGRNAPLKLSTDFHATQLVMWRPHLLVVESFTSNCLWTLIIKVPKIHLTRRDQSYWNEHEGMWCVCIQRLSSYQQGIVESIVEMKIPGLLCMFLNFLDFPFSEFSLALLSYIQKSCL